MSSEQSKLKNGFFWFANAIAPRFLFRDFFDNRKLFQQYIGTSEIQNRLSGVTDAKIFWLRYIISDIRKRNLPITSSSILKILDLFESDDLRTKKFLHAELKKMIRDNFRARNFPEFEACLEKIKPLDSIYERYFRLYARQNLRADVSLEDWKVLLQDAQAQNSSTQRNIISQLITKHLHLEDYDTSVAMFKDMTNKYGLALHDLRLVIGILKLAIKQERYDDARVFRKDVLDMDWGVGLSYFVSLKLAEVMVELELAEKKVEIKDGELWKSMFTKLKKLRTVPENKIYLKELENQFRILGEKHELLLDIRISNQEQHRLFEIVEDKLKNHTPFLLLRIGDADSYGLSTDKIDPDQVYRDCNAREMKWWGENIPEDVKKDIRQMFMETVLDTDIMGIPSVFRFISDLAEPGNSFKAARNQRGSVAVMDSMTKLTVENQFLPSMVFTENRCHHVLFNQKALARLVSKVDHVVVVSRHADEKIKPMFHDVEIDTLRIPDEGLKQESLPFKVRGLAEELKTKVRKGSLVLVSAGFAGKYFLKIAKDQGAVALDVGAMADYWVGIKSRGVSELV